MGRSWWFPISKGGKNLEPDHISAWGDPKSGERTSGYFMPLGKINLDGLKMYDTDEDFEISMNEMIAWLESVPDRFNMDWFYHTMDESPCRLENGRIHLNHSLWWFNYWTKHLNTNRKTNLANRR
eukprot:UN10095